MNGSIIIMGILSAILIYLIISEGHAINNVMADVTFLTSSSIDALQGR